MDRRALVTGLTLSRLPFMGLGTWSALEGARLATITFGMAGYATDMGDGMLARRWDVTSEEGSNLDSLVDMGFYLLQVYWVYLFAPAAVENHLGLIVAFVIAYAILIGIRHVLEQTIAQHDAVSRTAGTAGAFVALWFIWQGYTPWLILVMALVATADVAHRLHGAVQAIARRRRGVDEGA